MEIKQFIGEQLNLLIKLCFSKYELNNTLFSKIMSNKDIENKGTLVDIEKELNLSIGHPINRKTFNYLIVNNIFVEINNIKSISFYRIDKKKLHYLLQQQEVLKNYDKYLEKFCILFK